MLGTGLQGKTLGIVGLGAIGSATARRGRAFGMKIAFATDVPPNPATVAELEARQLSLEELAEAADVLSVHCSLTDTTRHLVDRRLLGMMKTTAYLINAARGPIVDEDALVDALRCRAIAGAGLDVFEHEPHVHPGLLELDNVVLLPHIGSATVETRTAMAELAAQNVVAVVKGEPPITPVNHVPRA
jgi:lactate dehydrogenase-like 2-hydroxyacid dehydrogenase